MLKGNSSEVSRESAVIMKFILAAMIITTVLAAASLVTVIFITVSSRSAEAGELPSGAKICDRYVEVTGGRDAYAKINTRVTRGKFAMPAQGLVMDLTTYSKRPDFMYALIESDMVGRIERGVADGVAWDNSMMAGPSVKEGAEKDQMLNSAIFNKMAIWRKVYDSVECTADTTIDGTGYYEVVMIPKKGSKETHYFDKETGLLAISKTIVQTQMGAVPTEVHSTDYRELDGIKVSFKSVVSVMGQKREITVESMEHNVEIPEDTFVLPDAIKSILEKEKTKAKQSEE
jgi:hypothetical protein